MRIFANPHFVSINCLIFFLSVKFEPSVLDIDRESPDPLLSGRQLPARSHKPGAPDTASASASAAAPPALLAGQVSAISQKPAHNSTPLNTTKGVDRIAADALPQSADRVKKPPAAAQDTESAHELDYTALEQATRKFQYGNFLSSQCSHSLHSPLYLLGFLVF